MASLWQYQERYKEGNIQVAGTEVILQQIVFQQLVRVALKRPGDSCYFCSTCSVDRRFSQDGFSLV